MKQVYRSVYAIGAFFLSALIFSCNKEAGEKTPPQPSGEVLASLQETVQVQAVLNNALAAIMGVSAPEANGQVSGRKYGCATITATPGDLTNFPKDIVVNFGTEECTAREYKGIVSFTLNKWIYEPGASFEPAFDAFHVNGYKIEGKYTITTVEPNVFKVEIREGILTSPDGVRYDLTGEQWYTQTAGGDTPLEFNDDVFSITGDVAGTSSLGYDIKANIKTPLIRSVDCDFTRSGIMYLENDGIVGDLDFGDGTCDNEATILIDLGGGLIVDAPFTLPF